MAAKTRRADVVVGVDVGMTCTGVAYSWAPNWPDPIWLQQWPGRKGDESRSKVITAVSHDTETGELTSWGEMCDPESEEFEYNRLFKLFLDPRHRDPRYENNPDVYPELEEVQRWYRDYLRGLYKYILSQLQRRIPDFQHKRTDFLFSVPNAWLQNAAMVKDINRLVREAGYGAHPNHTAEVSISEAEAAAIYVLKQQMSKGDVFIACDAGGGTTDVNILKVETVNNAEQRYHMKSLTHAEGDLIGSALIDYRILSLIKQRLYRVRDHLPGDTKDIAARMMQDGVESFKISFGSQGSEVPNLYINIRELNAGINLPQAHIKDSKMVIAREVLKGFFDEQLEKMFCLIDQQIETLRSNSSAEKISYIVLSGGLGSSPYVQDELINRYQKGRAGGEYGINVLVADQPQLAVVKGMVAARVQTCRNLPEIQLTHRCPVSYGILTRRGYDQEVHRGEKVVIDPFDKGKWVEDQIDWLIKKGDVVKVDDPPRKTFTRKVSKQDEAKPWTMRIIMSTLNRNELPSSLRRAGAREICNVKAMLREASLERKNGRWWQPGKAYNVAQFEIRLLISAGLEFQVWATKDDVQRQISREHDQLKVDWQSVTNADDFEFLQTR